MGKLMNVLGIHDLMPCSLNNVINPKVAKNLSSFTLSSKNNQIVVVAEHHVSSSWFRHWTIMLHLFPYVSQLNVLIKIIQVNHLFTLVISTSENPKSLKLVTTSCVIFSWSKPIRRLFNTKNFESLNWIKPTFKVACKVTNFILNFELNS